MLEQVAYVVEVALVLYIDAFALHSAIYLTRSAVEALLFSS